MAMDVQELKSNMTADEIEEFDNLANSKKQFKQCVHHWTDYQVQLAIHDGRLTRKGASAMYHDLMDVITDCCHEHIAPPD